MLTLDYQREHDFIWLSIRCGTAEAFLGEGRGVWEKKQRWEGGVKTERRKGDNVRREVARS